MDIGSALVGGALSGVFNLIGGSNANNANSALAANQARWAAETAATSRQHQSQMQWDAMNFTEEETMRAREFSANQAGILRDWNSREAQVLRDWNASQANTAMDFTRRMQESANSFSERMAATAWQRGVADMKAAGINPILAYQKGAGAAPIGAMGSGNALPGALPSGAMGQGFAGSASGGGGGIPTYQRAQMENVLGPAIATAMQAANVIQGIQQTAAQTKTTEAQAELMKSQARNVDVNTGLQTAQTITETGRPELVAAEVGRVREQAALARSQAGLASAATVSEAERAELLRGQQLTERERPEQVRAETARTLHQGNLARTQEHLARTYGPPGLVGSTVGGVSQTLNSIWQSIRQSLQ